MNFTSLIKQVNNLDDKIVNNGKDIFKVIPGPDVAIANIDHEDIESSLESEMIEAALKLTKMRQNESTWVN